MPTILWRLPVEWIDTVEAVKLPAMIIRSSGHFTKSICKMWVKDRVLTEGLSGPCVVNRYHVREMGSISQSGLKFRLVRSMRYL